MYCYKKNRKKPQNNNTRKKKKRINSGASLRKTDFDENQRIIQINTDIKNMYND